jgi:hypothetical protein
MQLFGAAFFFLSARLFGDGSCSGRHPGGSGVVGGRSGRNFRRPLSSVGGTSRQPSGRAKLLPSSAWPGPRLSLGGAR